MRCALSFRRPTRLAADEAGNAAIVFTLTLLPILTAVGSAVDYTRASQMREKVQGVVDAALLAGLKTGSGQRVAQAEAHARAALAKEGVSVDVASFAPTASGGLRGRVKVTMPSIFGKLFGKEGIEVGAGAEGLYKPVAATGVSQACLLLTDPSRAESLRVNGGGTILAPNCEVHVHTTANVGAVFNGGSTFSVKRVCLKGAGYIANGQPKIGPVETGCAAAAEPYAAEMRALADAAPSGCSETGKVHEPGGEGKVAIEPGVYCGGLTFNGRQDIALKPGLYVFKGGPLTVNGGSTLSGTGVTLYFADADSRLQLNGGAAMALSSPLAGAYAGLLMFERPGLARSEVVLNASRGHGLQGLLYLPSRTVTVNGGSGLVGEGITMIVNALTVNGGASWSLEPAAKAVPVATAATAAPEIILRY